MAVVDASLLDALRKYDTPTLSNAIETFGIRPADEGFVSGGVRCLFPELGPMVGYAATAMIRSRRNGGPGAMRPFMTTYRQCWRRESWSCRTSTTRLALAPSGARSSRRGGAGGDVRVGLE